MNILITGIAGHLGSRLAHWILSHIPDSHIIGIDNLSCGYPENISHVSHSHPLLYNLTLGDGNPLLKDIFREHQPDYCFHLSAYAAEGLSPFLRSFNYRSNLLATTEIINCCISHPVQRLVYTSSMAIYGRQQPPFSEDLPFVPIDPYGIAKAASEQDLRIAQEQHSLNYCVIRPHNIYGINQDIWTPYRNVLGIWMTRTLQGLPMRIYGDGSQIRAFSQITDCLPCLWEAATSPHALNQTINLGGTRPVTILATAQLLRWVMGCGDIEHHEPRHEVHEAWSTWQRSLNLLHYQDSTPLPEGLAEMWGWAKKAWERFPSRQRHYRCKPLPAPLEITRGLYSFWKENAK